eukprot:1718647-Rhodomonas_salina.2
MKRLPSASLTPAAADGGWPRASPGAPLPARAQRARTSAADAAVQASATLRSSSSGRRTHSGEALPSRACRPIATATADAGESSLLVALAAMHSTLSSPEHPPGNPKPHAELLSGLLRTRCDSMAGAATHLTEA